MQLASVFCLAVLVASAGSAGAQDGDGPTMVVLVRHAEKAEDPGDDPPLSPAGAARAQALAAALADARVDAVITTQYRRTRDTAAPLAEAHAVTPLVVRAGGETPAHAREVARAVRRQAPGLVVVVGHSNTVPAIIAALGGPRLEELCEAEYAGLFTLLLGAGQPRLVASRYGPPDDSGSAGCSRGMMQK